VQLEHQFTVPAPPEVVWAAVVDPARVAPCMPGATLTEVNGSEFTGSVKVKLGPVSLLYKGSGQFVEIDEQSRRVVIKASGKDSRGNGTASATVTVTLKADGANTHGTVTTDLAITGKPAQFGRGVMQDVSDKLLGQFVACLETRLGESSGPPPPAPPGPTPGDVGQVEPEPVTAATDEAPGDPVAVAPATPPAAAPAAPPTTPPATPRGSDDALNLGSAVLPVLAKTYWKPVVAALVVIVVLVWIFTR
jgi:carbon monoxide dehydrogenase subunit G